MKGGVHITSTQAKELRDFPGYEALNNEPVKAMPVYQAVSEYDKEVNEKIVPLGGMLPISPPTQSLWMDNTIKNIQIFKTKIENS